MEINNLLSVLAMVASLLITGIGFPIQIWKNYKTKDTFSISYVLFFFSFLSYTLWSLRAYAINDWYMLMAYTPGVLFSIIVLFQIYLYRYRKIEQIIIEAIHSGKTHTLDENLDVKQFLKKIPLKKAMEWMKKIDNSFKLWRLVLNERKVSFKDMIECAEKYHHSIVWCIALERSDIQTYLSQFSTSEAIAYAEKSEKDAVWEFILKREDVQKELHKRCINVNGAIQYVKKINTPALEYFFFPKKV